MVGVFANMWQFRHEPFPLHRRQATFRHLVELIPTPEPELTLLPYLRTFPLRYDTFASIPDSCSFMSIKMNFWQIDMHVNTFSAYPDALPSKTAMPNFYCVSDLITQAKTYTYIKGFFFVFGFPLHTPPTSL